MERPTFSPLKRLARAISDRGADRLRSTDWWAVLVEIAIVVLGILIAFKLDAWAERRSERQSERLLWQRLAEETRTDIDTLDRIIGQHLESAVNFQLLARAVARPEFETQFRGRGPAGCNLLRLPAVRRQSSGAIGQASGARLDLISDARLRAALRTADSSRLFSDRQLDYFRDNFSRYGERIEPHMQWRFTGKGGTACEVDIAGLRSDPAAVSLLPKLYRDHRQFARYRALEAKSLRAVEKRVLCLSSGRCKPSS